MLPDRLDPRRYFMYSTLLAALANGLILLVGSTSDITWGLRFIAGACMAGGYPVALKMASGWAKGDLGLLVAILSAGMTFDNAVPHMFDALGGLDWRVSIAVSSVLAVLVALAANLVTLGPGHAPSPPFEARAMLAAFQTPARRMVNFGYLGHMWEMIALWVWAGLFFDASFHAMGGWMIPPSGRALPPLRPWASAVPWTVCWGVCYRTTRGAPG